MQALFSALPSVDACLTVLEKEFPMLSHDEILVHCRRVLDAMRSGIREGRIADAKELSLAHVLDAMRMSITKESNPRLRRVINGSGVVVHTNLGRSTLAREAQDAVLLAASGYCNLEFDLETGERGSRTALVESLLCTLTGAEAALVVNNNAAAVLLMLDTLCKGGEVLLSRGQLVEIGGSFRIPNVMEHSGAILREVGTTNRTHISDYAGAMNEHTRAVLWVHPSNFRVIGFHASVDPAKLAALAHSHNLPMLEDLGSGSLMDLSPWGLHDEPCVPEVLQSGVDVVTFSGDKVLGGPQSGIIVGKKCFLDAMKHNQLLRALRCDKLTLAALEATLRLYRNPAKAREAIPTLRHMTMSAEELRVRAETLRDILTPEIHERAECLLKKDYSRVGGGAFPEQGMPTTLVCIRPIACGAADLKKKLLASDPPLVGRLDHGMFQIDPRTIEENEFPHVASALREALS